jgi:glutaminyl-tRNA synthetase
VQATLHWVAAAASVPAEIRVYNQLFLRPDPGAGGDYAADLNPQSLEVLASCRVEPSLATENSAAPVQFERQGYFCRDPDSTPGRLVFNRTIGLRDSYAKTQAAPAAVKGRKG